MSEIKQVLVYGSLRKGLGNDIHKFARATGASVEFLGHAIIPGEMHSLGGFPYVWFPEECNTEVVGEVYHLNDPQGYLAAALDRLEGYPRFYNRKEVDTPFGKAWVYFFDKKDVHAPVANGDWLQHRVGVEQAKEAEYYNLEKENVIS